MDGQRFDDFARALAVGTSRRRMLRGVAGGLGAGLAAALGVRAARAESDCATFCKELPPGQRGQCVADCQHGEGLFAACERDPARLCPAADGNSATCCASGQPCRDGHCGCPEFHEFCRATQTCVINNCLFNQRGRLIFNPDTCACDCRPEYVENACGYCMLPCESVGEPCPGGTCQMSADGQLVCTGPSWSVFCSPPNATCGSTADCCPCGQNNVCTPDGFCRAAP